MKSPHPARVLLAAFLLAVLGSLPASADTKRVGIVYSDTSRANYWGDFGYYQLYMGMQYQCAMAGIPYDLLEEDALSDSATLANYDALVIPLLDVVTVAERPQILAALNTAASNGLQLLTSGWFLSLDPTGEVHPNFESDLESLIGVDAVNFYGPVPANVLAADVTHPAMPSYVSGETIRTYNQIWTTTWQPAGAADPAQSSVLCNYQFTGSVEPAILAIETTDGRRNVHFANEQIMQDTNVLWSALQWALYGDETPVGLRLGRQRSLFFARNDMDQSQFIEEVPLVHVPLLDVITDWKQQHGFVSSYYINIGNDPAEFAYTDWNVSGPLYQQYRALGSEIGTHSYTHPHDTKLLTPTQLDFEFKQSALEIEANLGGKVPGAAVPGMPESMEVVETVAPWFDYLSGRAAIADTVFGYAGAFGNMRPDLDLFYFTLNTSPDFSLVGYLGYTAEQAQQIWVDEYNGHHEHAPLPVVHWLWHDYAAVQQEPGYTAEMFDLMVGTAAANGSEFVTGEDLHQRVESLRAANLDVIQVDPDTLTVQVTSDDTGRLCLTLPEARQISSVTDWYAYDDNKLFLPRNGGTFTVSTAGTPASVTRVSALPQRADLLSLQGDGAALAFSFQHDGVGKAEVLLNESGGPLQIFGADAVSRDGGKATLTFTTAGTRFVTISLAGADTDGDGLPDSVETLDDPDGDGLPNIWDADSDNDTMTDGWESSFGLNPALASDATLDSDGDGQANVEEFASITSPLDPDDFFQMTWEQGPPFVVTVDAKPDRIYTLQRTNSLTTGNWTAVNSSGPLASPLSLELTDPSPPDQSTFYRVKVSLP